MTVPARVVSFLVLVTILLASPVWASRAAAQATPVAGACAATPAAPAPAFPLTITDDAGREVTIEQVPERLVSIAPSNTETLFALGLGDRVVGVDSYSNYPPAAKQKPQMGEYIAPSLEAIVAAQPDLVLGAEAHLGSVLPALQDLDIPTVVVEPGDLDEVFSSITLIGQITGEASAAERLACSLQTRVAAVSEAIAGAPRPRVFFELDPSLYTAGPGSFVDDLIDRAGGENVAAAAGEMWPQLSAEAVVSADPQVILLADQIAGVTPEMVAERPGWQAVSAVVNDRVVSLDPDLVARPGPRVVDGLEIIAAALHPDRFPQGSS